MYLPFAPGFSGDCARERKSNGAEKSSTNANNLRVIFIRERILTLTIGVVVAQHSFARAQDKAEPLQRMRLGYFFSSSCSSCRTAAAATESSCSSRNKRTP